MLQQQDKNKGYYITLYTVPIAEDRAVPVISTAKLCNSPIRSKCKR